MSTGPKSGWGGSRPGAGGARPGAGRPREPLSVAVCRERLELAKKISEEYGFSIDEVVIRFIYDKSLCARDRLAAAKLHYEHTTPKISEGGEADKTLGPGIYLPGEKPDPSKVVPIKQTG